MEKLIKNFILGFLGGIATAGSMEVIYQPPEMNDIVDTRKLEEELQKPHKINIEGKPYLLYFSEELQEGIKKDSSLIGPLSASIDEVRKKEAIDEEVIGFEFVLFKGKIYTEAFLGENAK